MIIYLQYQNCYIFFVVTRCTSPDSTGVHRLPEAQRPAIQAECRWSNCVSDSDSQREPGQKRAHSNKLKRYFHSYR